MAALLAAFLAPAGAAAERIIYDDTLQGGFQDWSWGGDSNFANPAPVHGGSRSISFDGQAWNAVSFGHPDALDLAAHGELRLWIHGGTTGGQKLRLFLQHGGTATPGVALDPFIEGGAVAAGAWRRVVVPLAAVPAFASLGAFDRIDLQSDVPGSQPRLYLDDLSLAAPAPDQLFRDGFEGAGAVPGGLVIERDLPFEGLPADRFSWRDRSGLARSAVLTHNDAGTGPGGTRGGALRQFRYQAGGAPRIVAATGDAFGGFGYVVAHPASEAPGRCTGGGDPSSLGHFTPGQFQRVFEGRHHAIFRFRQAYPRYCTRSGAAARYDVPVTIDWVFANGRDHPLWSVTWDLSAVPVDRLEDDARGPYGQMRIDGAASDASRALIGGVAWGDHYRFTTTTSPASFDSQWRWDQPNTIPFVTLWTAGVDATMGLVQSLPIQLQDAGGYWGQHHWGQTSAAGPGCPGTGARMPCDYNWPYQSINYELYGGPTRNARLAWGTNFGFLGSAQYRVRGNAAYGGGALALPGDPMAPGWPRKSYATWIVLGTHSSDPVGAVIGEMEAVQATTLSASIGSVATTGPAGVADPTPHSYTPAGWDPVHGALTFHAAANRLDANVAIAGGRQCAIR